MWRFWELMHKLGIHHYDRGTDGCMHEKCEICGAYDKAEIPRGCFCYSGKLSGWYTPCPYWQRLTGVGEMVSGYCRYLEKGDAQINREKRWTCRTKQPDGTWLEDNRSAEEMGEMLSLLWDRVKECDVKRSSLTDHVFRRDEC